MLGRVKVDLNTKCGALVNEPGVMLKNLMLIWTFPAGNVVGGDDSASRLRVA